MVLTIPVFNTSVKGRSGKPSVQNFYWEEIKHPVYGPRLKLVGYTIPIFHSDKQYQYIAVEDDRNPLSAFSGDRGSLKYNRIIQRIKDINQFNHLSGINELKVTKLEMIIYPLTDINRAFLKIEEVDLNKDITISGFAQNKFNISNNQQHTKENKIYQNEIERVWKTNTIYTIPVFNWCKKGSKVDKFYWEVIECPADVHLRLVGYSVPDSKNKYIKTTDGKLLFQDRNIKYKRIDKKLKKINEEKNLSDEDAFKSKRGAREFTIYSLTEKNNVLLGAELVTDETIINQLMPGSPQPREIDLARRTNNVSLATAPTILNSAENGITTNRGLFTTSVIAASLNPSKEKTLLTNEDYQSAVNENSGRSFEALFNLSIIAGSLDPLPEPETLENSPILVQSKRKSPDDSITNITVSSIYGSPATLSLPNSSSKFPSSDSNQEWKRMKK